MGIIVAENLKNCLENPDSDTETKAENRSSRSADREEITEFLKGLSRFHLKEFIVNQFEDSKLTAKEGKYLFCGFCTLKK